MLEFGDTLVLHTDGVTESMVDISTSAFSLILMLIPREEKIRTSIRS